MAARTNIAPLGSWNNTFGRYIEGDGMQRKQHCYIIGVTDGTRWTKDDATGTATARINAQKSSSINKINSRDFFDYDVLYYGRLRNINSYGPSQHIKMLQL